ncbi:VanZ family protein [Lachnotalea glycerini]|uniref:VanZ family protein n=1 Tax=Lachnotalea glycerini TaxID=1763509 RepID=A0A371JFN0_9FIRM|nr:VanZ family protein [Lachnotalea glycerini]RDY31535.1 VanZ family protein [Lachnotalea glycerini]
MKKKEANKLEKFGILLFIIYIILLFYFLFFAESMGRTISDREYCYNLVLFKEIKRFIVYRKELGIMAVFTNIIGNIICFIPFGCMLPILSTRCRKFALVTLISFELSLVIEVMQLLLKVGSFDVDDMVLNTCGGMLGFVFYHIADRLIRKWLKK